jgi:hypothetical protein
VTVGQSGVCGDSRANDMFGSVCWYCRASVTCGASGVRVATAKHNARM